MTTPVAFIRKVAIAVAAAVIVVLLWRALLLGVGAMVLFVVAFIAYQELALRHAASRFRRAYRSFGKDVLLVYSNSPHWQSYVEAHWIRRWGSRAVVLNWSDRSTWNQRQPEVALFHALSTHREYNPLAIVVPPRGRPVVVRFWKAFRDYKHGKDLTLKQQETELERVLARYPPPFG